jgi:uncharacterized protein YndB with AHSA1/START domain
MKIIKRILFLFLFVFAVVLVVALFMKKEYEVKREITINQPIEKVFDFVKYLKNQEKYSTWARKDKKTVTTFSGIDGQIGSTSTWSGNSEVGVGEQEIKKIDFNKRIDIELRFKEPFEGKANAYLTTEAIDSSKTKVVWGIKGRDNYPMNIMQVIMDYDKMMGTEFDAGLKNLKTILEK